MVPCCIDTLPKSYAIVMSRSRRRVSQGGVEGVGAEFKVGVKPSRVVYEKGIRDKQGRVTRLEENGKTEARAILYIAVNHQSEQSVSLSTE